MKFILKINGSESKNAEFVGWTPVKCTLSIDGYSGDTQMPVTITTEHNNKSGRINLFIDNATSATPVGKIQHDFQSEAELTFYVAGEFDKASIAEKDTYILVKHDSDPNFELKKYIMVRIRKNANKLSTEEIRLFLETFVRLNYSPAVEEYQGRYTVRPSALLHEIVLMHTYDAASEIHNRESFHPWHRAYLMHLEREMQNLEPKVTVPYWKFDEKADKVFTEQFIGKTLKVNPTPQERLQDITMPIIDHKNPLYTYKDQTVWGPLTRSYHETDPADGKPYSAIADEEDVIRFSSEFIKWCRFEEGRSHNQAHNSFNGRVVDIGKDPVDPLFFMMHGNVDRLWALWQQTYDRYDPNNVKTYPMPYSFKGDRGDDWADANPNKLDRRASFYRVGSYDLGNFADDELWPWGMHKEKDERNSDGTPKDIVDRLSRPWRRYADSEYGAAVVPELFLKFPKSPNSDIPEGPPTVKDTIDYQGRVNQKSGLGFDYDDIPYFNKDKRIGIQPATFNKEQFNNAFLNAQLSVSERLDAAKNALLLSDEDQDAALQIIKNPKTDSLIQLKAVDLVSEGREEFLDTALNVVKNEYKEYEDYVISALIRKIYAAKRSNPNFPSRRAFFFDILRGLLKSDNVKLRQQSFEILTSQGDNVAEEILLEVVTKALIQENYQDEIISPVDALFLLRNSSKNQHIDLFRKLAIEGVDDEIRMASIQGLASDPGSVFLLAKFVSNTSEKFRVRETSALTLHSLDKSAMNTLATQILSNSEPGEGIKLFRSARPNTDEVDFKAGLLNMLTFTSDINLLKNNEELKSSLREVIDPSTQNKANFRSSVEAFAATSEDGPTIVEQLAAELLSRLEGNNDD